MSSWDEVRAIALALPEVEDSTSYNTPALKVRGKLIARLDKDGATLVLPVAAERKELLLEAAPDVFFQTPHYEGWPIVLVRLATAREAELAGLLEAAWRAVAPRRLTAAYDASRG